LYRQASKLNNIGMRILYFHQHFATRKGAGGTRSYELAQRLIRRGHEVTVICGTNLRANTTNDNARTGEIHESLVDGIRVVEIVLPYSNYDGLTKRSITFIRFAFAGIRLALKEDYDLLFATSTPLTAGIPGIVAKLLRSKPFVFEVRDLWPELPKAMGVIGNPLILGMLSLLEWSSYRASDGCVALAPGIAEGIRRRSRSDHPICVVPNGCDLDLFNAQVARQDVWPDFNENDLVCVFTGAHGQANGLDAALDAGAELMRRKETGIYLVFVGDGREKPRLIRRKDDEGLANCLFFDLVPKERLAELLAAADVGMQLLANVPAFYYGTSPNKFFDYIASGLPVVNNYPGWLADMIDEHKCGVAIPPDDPVAFADALVKLRDDPAGRKKMGTNSRVLAEQSFSRDMLGEKFSEFLEQQLQSREGDGSKS
jgi:glycosyltransferase involved in cell wall biosynthesis